MHQNARPHTANWDCKVVRPSGWEVMDNCPYRRDVAPSDFHLFGPIQTRLAGERFVTDGDVKQAVVYWPRTIDDFVCPWIQALVPR